jgi:hypothetical protein
MSERLLGAALCLLVAGAAVRAEPGVPPQESSPYRVWWSFPVDDVSAIEIDEPDMHQSRFGTRWPLVLELRRCDAARARRAAPKRAVDLREIRVEVLGSDGATRAETRCILPLGKWRERIGERLVERLEGELDAHVAFLTPRHAPPQKDEQ